MPLRELPEPKGPLAERTTSDGRRRLQLNQDEREAFRRSEMIDAIVIEFLDLSENSKTYKQIADTVGITVAQMKNLTRTEEFQDRYNDRFMQLGQDPRVTMIQARIAELLPKAFMTMRTALEDADVPWTVKRDMAFKVMELSGINKPEVMQNDRKEIQRFFEQKSNETDDGSIQISIPTSYMKAMQDYQDGEHIDNEVEEDVIEGEYTQSDVGSDQESEQ